MTHLLVAVHTLNYFSSHCSLQISGQSYATPLKPFPTHWTRKAVTSTVLCHVRSQAGDAVTVV